MKHSQVEGSASKSQVQLPGWILAVSLILSNVVAFLLGCGVHVAFWSGDILHYLHPDHEGVDSRAVNDSSFSKHQSRVTTASSSSSIPSGKSWSIFDGFLQTSNSSDEEVGQMEDDDGDNENEIPVGNQLFVDIKNVDASFLSSKKRLVNAMFSILSGDGDEPLPYYCYALNHKGFSCHGKAEDARFSLYTFPMDGVITFDIFSSDGDDLVPLLDDIVQLFAIHQRTAEDEDIFPAPEMIWAHKLRNFREEFSIDRDAEKSPNEGELTQDVLSKRSYEMKNQLVFAETKFQNVHIFDVIDTRFHSLASYEKSKSNDGSYESLHPEFYRPDRIVFLDGDSQSSLYGEAVYHEGLVHAAMLAHSNPKRVAIVGGGEGATLREVLKHSTVEEVVMVDIDGEFVELCKKYLPEWSDCSDLEGSDAFSCFDDSRARVYYDDAFQWFIDRFEHDTHSTHVEKEEKFDVIIMDACDPSNEFVKKLYIDSMFIHSLRNGLSEYGLLVAQVGRAPSRIDGADETAILRNKFEEVGFQSMHFYDEGRSGFYQPWSYLAALKSSASRKLWYQNAAQVEAELQKRVVKTLSGKPTLLYFDSSTMMDYQLPRKTQEAIYCHELQHTQECEEVQNVIQERKHKIEDHIKEKPYNPLRERYNASNHVPGVFDFFYAMKNQRKDIVADVNEN